MKPLLLVTGAAGRVGRLLRPVLAERYALRLLDLADPGASAQEEAHYRWTDTQRSNGYQRDTK